MKNSTLISVIAFVSVVSSFSSHADSVWVTMIGAENARLVSGQTDVSPATKKERQQLELIAHGANIKALGMTIENTTGTKFNRNGDLTAARNWSYGYFNDNHGISLDLIKGDWLGTGPNIAAVGYAYKKSLGDFSFRVNPTLARIAVKQGPGRYLNDHGVQLNLRGDYQVNDRLSLRVHPQFATWRNDSLGSTMKLELSATMNLTDNKRHKLSVLHESYLVNNKASGMKTRWVGENSPIAGVVPGTEQVFKVRYAYVF
ncbi:hypothetical protein [Paraferrimonas haliotis]|uniref:Porin n=1 Tax=Paraferrimonas haliotis TaxID=2013866 RepID=A0AA37TM44_9GAMM|nr:hypothetical protein [Paraferrimonas haliotis]GLS84067.1 hypothetical protein GCM10007894_20440 [Paraferrimonas haliotis]